MCRAPARVRALPTVFCLEQNRDEVVAFLDSLRSRFVIKTRQRTHPRKPGKIRTISPYFDFSTIRQITPAAALVLAAEYDRARIRRIAEVFSNASDWRKVDPSLFQLSLIDVDRWDPNVLRTLAQLGFFELLEIPEPNPDNVVEAEHILSFRSGKNVDSAVAGGLTDELKNLLQKLKMPTTDATVHLQGRLVDAIQNVRDHAYPQNVSMRFPHVGQWWMTASVDQNENRLDVVVYDQGVTIPGSIPHSPRSSEIVNYLKKIFNLEEDVNNPIYDGKSIKAAIEVGQSGTEQPHRGRGLMFMRELVSYCRDGELRILSRNGGYSYRRNGHESEWSHPTSIGGTLIEWKLFL